MLCYVGEIEKSEIVVVTLAWAESTFITGPSWLKLERRKGRGLRKKLLSGLLGLVSKERGGKYIIREHSHQ